MISYHHFLNALRALHHDLWKKLGYLLLLIEFSMCQDFFRLFVMFSTDSVLFLSPLLPYSIQLLLQKLLTNTGLE